MATADITNPEIGEETLPVSLPHLSSSSHRTTYIVVGVVAATVSAATVAFVFWSRARHAQSVESVQDLLDNCRNQVRDIEKRLGELHHITTGSTTFV